VHRICDQAEAVRRALDASEMAMPSGYHPLTELEAEPGKVVEIASTLGLSTVLCPSLAGLDYPEEARDRYGLGERLGRIGARLPDAGLRSGWHNHDVEFQSLPGSSLALDLLLQGAPDPGWTFDVAWSLLGGQGPGKRIRRLGGRILSAHAKDIAPVGTDPDQNGWTSVGSGTVDGSKLEKDLHAAGCNHLVIKHANPADDAAFARVSALAFRGR